MSGRVAALDARARRRSVTVYIGAASGVLEVGNGGTTFKRCSTSSRCNRSAPSPSIQESESGGVARARRGPVNSVSIGDGVYKSVDA